MTTGSMTMPVWIPDSGGGPAILLIQEIFGVGPYIRAVGERLAAAGYVVGAPDLFWRFAPGWDAGHDEAGLGGVDAAGRQPRSRAAPSATASPRSSTSPGCPRSTAGRA